MNTETIELGTSRNGIEEEQKGKRVTVKGPDFREAVFDIKGVTPLVIHRFSAKTKEQMKQKMEQGKSASSRKDRPAKLTDDSYEESRYTAISGWDGFHAGAIRNGMISVCRLVGYKMTLAKLSIFVVADGCDAKEPQIPLIRILGEPKKLESIALTSTGEPYVTVRAIYNNWGAKIRIRWDNDQFSVTDITNLLVRLGIQAGICEGRPDSKNSPGMGWGCFEVKGASNEHSYNIGA